MNPLDASGFFFAPRGRAAQTVRGCGIASRIKWRGARVAGALRPAPAPGAERVLILKLIAGAVLGGLAGLWLSRARVCGAGQCRARPNRLASLVACAALGAAIAYALAGR